VPVLLVPDRLLLLLLVRVGLVLLPDQLRPVRPAGRRLAAAAVRNAKHPAGLARKSRPVFALSRRPRGVSIRLPGHRPVPESTRRARDRCPQVTAPANRPPCRLPSSSGTTPYSVKQTSSQEPVAQSLRVRHRAFSAPIGRNPNGRAGPTGIARQWGASRARCGLRGLLLVLVAPAGRVDAAAGGPPLRVGLARPRAAEYGSLRTKCGSKCCDRPRRCKGGAMRASPGRSVLLLGQLLRPDVLRVRSGGDIPLVEHRRQEFRPATRPEVAGVVGHGSGRTPQPPRPPPR
jgi:hypothetical protein